MKLDLHADYNSTLLVFLNVQWIIVILGSMRSECWPADHIIFMKHVIKFKPTTLTNLCHAMSVASS